MKSENAKTDRISKPKKIIYVWHYLEWGGAQVYFLGIAARIKDRASVKFVFPRETARQFIAFCDNLGIEYEFLDFAADLRPATTLKRKIERHWNKFRAEYRLLKFLKRFDLRGSVLHIELTPWQSLTALMLLCRRAGQVFITMHNALPAVPGWRRRLWKLKFSLLTKLENFHIFPSNEHAKQSLEPFVARDYLAKTIVTYTNVNPDEVERALSENIDRRAYAHKFNLPVDKFLIFCLGQFIDRKGRWIFLEAAQKVLKYSDDAAFVWISNSVLTGEEIKKIESFGLGENFTLIRSEDVGSEHLELMKFLRCADVYALPSYVEGLPISLLEAMSLGIPSISTNVYAIPEAVKTGETGILIEAGDSDQLAGAIEKLKNDEPLRKSLGINGREWVLANFNEKLVAERAFREYAESFTKK